ncbi:MAG: hypothetical protein NVS9B1_25170 [Candidatus Dormibacteraceae bacterium]
MTLPGSDQGLRDAAQQLASLYETAQELVERAQRDNSRREEEAERLADLLGRADQGAVARIMSAVRSANAAQLRTARTIAREITTLTAARSLETVHRYAGTLAAEAAAAAAERQVQIAELAEILGRRDSAAARAMMGASRDGEKAQLETAGRHAQTIAGLVHSAFSHGQPGGSAKPAPAPPAPALAESTAAAIAEPAPVELEVAAADAVPEPEPEERAGDPEAAELSPVLMLAPDEWLSSRSKKAKSHQREAR